MTEGRDGDRQLQLQDPSQKKTWPQAWAPLGLPGQGWEVIPEAQPVPWTQGRLPMTLCTVALGSWLECV